MDKKMVDAINDQINFELYSGYIYYAMAAYLDDLGLPGMTKWMIAQTQEEMFHAHKMFGYLAERGERVLDRRRRLTGESGHRELDGRGARPKGEIAHTGDPQRGGGCGNQGDTVSLQEYPINRFLGVRRLA